MVAVKIYEVDSCEHLCDSCVKNNYYSCPYDMIELHADALIECPAYEKRNSNTEGQTRGGSRVV